MPSETVIPVTNLNYEGTNNKSPRSQKNNNFETFPLVKCNNSVRDNSMFDKRKSGSVYGKLKYKYLGKNSEGNRFIRNVDL